MAKYWTDALAGKTPTGSVVYGRIRRRCLQTLQLIQAELEAGGGVMEIGKALSWDEVATIYDDKIGGTRKARTLPMDKVFDMVVALDCIYLHPFDGTAHLIEDSVEGEVE